MLNATLKQIIRNEDDGSHWMDFGFKMIGGAEGTVLVERSLAAHPRRIVERMLQQGADIRSVDVAKKEVQKAIVGASVSETVKGTVYGGMARQDFRSPSLLHRTRKIHFPQTCGPIGTVWEVERLETGVGGAVQAVKILNLRIVARLRRTAN